MHVNNLATILLDPVKLDAPTMALIVDQFVPSNFQHRESDFKLGVRLELFTVEEEENYMA